MPMHTPENGGCSCSADDCGSAGKHPSTSHGVNDATMDSDLIRGWWQRWPRANVGFATGAASGLVVLDVDPRNGEKSR